MLSSVLVRAVRWLIVVSAIGAAFALAMAGRAAYGELRSDFYPPHEPVPALGDRDLPGAQTIQFHTPLAEIRAWYLAPRNGAVIVLVHGTSSNRAHMLPEARILASAGYGLLLIDWPGSGESTGKTTWGSGERVALTAALDFIEKQPGVRPERIGVFAFSMGTLIAAQVAAVDDRVRALFLTGAFGDPDAALAYQFRQWGPLTAWPAVWAAHLAGMDLDGRRPRDVATLIAPRPIFIVAGSADDTVPPANARALYAAAHEPKTIWIVDGAHHGDYAAVAGWEYTERLVRFFDDSLLRAARVGAP